MGVITYLRRQFSRVVEADRAAVRAQKQRIEAEQVKFAKNTPLETVPQLLAFIHNAGGSVSTLEHWFSSDVECLALTAAGSGYLRIIGFKEGDESWTITARGEEEILPASERYSANLIASAQS
ncbi:hypothetical protein D9M68_745480 [compost metagenome]